MKRPLVVGVGTIVSRSKLGLLIGMTSHSNEQYGYMAVYLRIKGIVPPSSEGQ